MEPMPKKQSKAHGKETDSFTNYNEQTIFSESKNTMADFTIKGTELNICWKCIHTVTIWDVD